MISKEYCRRQFGRYAALALAICFVAPPGGLATAASFTCSSNLTRTEQTICSTPTLSRLDEEVAADYQSRLQHLDGDQRAELRSTQRAWARSTKACGTDVECLTKRYQGRLGELKDRHDDGPHPTGVGLPQIKMGAFESVQQAFDKVGSSIASSTRPLTESDWFVLGGLGVLCGVIGVIWLTVVAARFSVRRYSYPVFLNWNILFWFGGAVVLAVVSWFVVQGGFTPTGVALIFGASFIPWLIAVGRNVKNTNLFFGVAISIPQMMFSLVGPIFLFWLRGALLNDRDGVHR